MRMAVSLRIGLLLTCQECESIWSCGYAYTVMQLCLPCTRENTPQHAVMVDCTSCASVEGMCTFGANHSLGSILISTEQPQPFIRPSAACYGSSMNTLVCALKLSHCVEHLTYFPYVAGMCRPGAAACLAASKNLAAAISVGALLHIILHPHRYGALLPLVHQKNQNGDKSCLGNGSPSLVAAKAGMLLSQKHEVPGA